MNIRLLIVINILSAALVVCSAMSGTHLGYAGAVVFFVIVANVMAYLNKK